MRLQNYYGSIDAETADELDVVIAARRRARNETHRSRVDELVRALEADSN